MASKALHAACQGYNIGIGFKHWTMGADLMSTILINRKPIGQDEGDEEARLGEVHQPDLFRAQQRRA